MTNIAAVAENRWMKTAFILAFVTIGYNVVEGVVSVIFGAGDETLALFGFGLDSFVEVISGGGVLHMLMRLRKQGGVENDRFERNALRVTGFAFYLLGSGLAVTALISWYQQSRPETTVAGVVVAAVSIFSMTLLTRYKMQAGLQLQSDALVADARCTRTCLQLSYVLLASSLMFELSGLAGLDGLGALAIGVLSFREGKEAFEKARGKSCGCEDEGCH